MLICAKCEKQVQNSVMSQVTLGYYNVTVSCHGKTESIVLDHFQLKESESKGVMVFVPKDGQKPEKVGSDTFNRVGRVRKAKNSES